ncbi:MAG: hypothetical protein L0Z62_28630 [Gemmataceae bacterium]|nr:hypothetical protein [Gemmataceae bacterium]
MALRKRGDYWYGDSASDIREILAHPYHGALPCTHFADVICECGGRVFDLLIDDDHREADFCCVSCERNYLFHLADTDEPYEGDPDSDTEFRACPCDNNPNCRMEIVVGACVPKRGKIPRQVSIACRCTRCGLIGPYADWHKVQLSYERVFAHIRNRILPE